MIQLLIFVPALALFIGLLYGCWFMWTEDLGVVAVLGALVIGPLGIVLLMALADELWTEHPVFMLDERDWECAASHREPVTTYVKTGSVMSPITTHTTVCDLYARKP